MYWEIFTFIAIITPYIIWYLNWRKNRIKTIKPSPHTISANSYNICTCCAWYREIYPNLICLYKKGKIPLKEIRKRHDCFMDEAHFKSVEKW